MIEGHDIVCFAPDLWSDIWRNRHRLLSVFARRNRVLYVEPRTSLRKMTRQLRKGELRAADFVRRRVEEVRPNLFVYHDPLHLPRVAKPHLGAFIERRREALLARTLKRLGFARPILWLVRPNMWDLPGRFGEKALLYQIVDDYLSFPGAQRDPEKHRKREESLAARADLVVVTSQALLETKRLLHPQVHLVPNGVDAATLAAGEQAAGPVAPELAALPRPLVGYVGGVTGKIDIELLEEVALAVRRQLGGTLVLVGPVRVTTADDEAAVRRLGQLSQVFFAGQRPAGEVPAFLRAMDVCLIPYRLGVQATAIDPLKLYEYLAFGLPVVSVDIPSVRPFAEVVRIVERGAYASAVLDAARETARSEGALELAARRRELARANTWEARVETISRLLEGVLEARGVGAGAREQASAPA